MDSNAWYKQCHLTSAVVWPTSLNIILNKTQTSMYDKGGYSLKWSCRCSNNHDSNFLETLLADSKK